MHATPTGRPARGWPRAAGLFGVVLAMSVVRPGVLIAVPVLAMLALRRRATFPVALLSVLALFTALAGVRDGLWYAERAWAVSVAGWFAATSMALPGWRLSSRSLVAVLGSLAVAGAVLTASADGWATVDWTITDGMYRSVATTVDALTLLRQGRPLAPAVVSGLYEVVTAQAAVFPAMLALASMAAVGVGWWVVARVSGEGDQALAPVAGFRFNDHLVWVMIGGLLLVVTRWGGAVTRVGANLVVFMSALYALRGAGVVMFVTGGLSLVGYLLFAAGLALAAPVVVGVGILIGIGDTWLDLRGRAGEPAA